MTTTTKKELIDRIAVETKQKRTAVKRTVQSFLEHVIHELSRGNRLEFRDFGVFEIHDRAPRLARNPKTFEQITIPARKTVKFKSGRLMRLALDADRTRRNGVRGNGGRTGGARRRSMQTVGGAR